MTILAEANNAAALRASDGRTTGADASPSGVSAEQIHVERLIYSVLSDLNDLLAIRNSANADLLAAEAGNISAIYARAATLASHLREVARAA